MNQVVGKNKCLASLGDLLSFIVCVIIYIVFGVLFSNGLILILSCCAYSTVMIIKSRKNIMLWIISFFSFFCIYSILLFHWFDIIEYSSLYGYKYFHNDFDIMMTSAKCLYLFYATIYVLFPKKAESSNNNPIFDNITTYSNVALPYLISITIISIVSLYFIVRSFSSGYSESPYYEYLIVFYILALFYSGNRRSYLIPIYILLTINSIFVFASGDRGSAMQFLLVIFFVRYQHRIKKKTLIIILVLGIVFLSGIGSWRGYYDFSLSIFSNAFRALLNNKLALNTAYAADAAGHCIIRLSHDYSVWGRLKLFGEYLAQVFIGSSMFGNDVNLSALSQIKYNYHGGGGLLTYYAYFYIGYFGCILSGILVSYYLKKVGKYKNADQPSIYYRVIVVYFCSTMTRWFLYSPAPLFRGMLFLLICTWFMRKLETIMS